MLLSRRDTPALRRVLAAFVPVALGAAVIAIVPASPAAAATCTDDAPTSLRLAPPPTTAMPGDSITVTATETCDGPGAGDDIVIKVSGTNPQTAEGLTDDQGRLTYSYYDDNGAGTDTITACTTALTTQACDTTTVLWDCGEGYFPSGAGCSRIPPYDLNNPTFTPTFGPEAGVGFPLGALPVGALPSSAAASDLADQLGLVGSQAPSGVSEPTSPGDVGQPGEISSESGS
jgi:hypothetical protein